MRLYRFSVAEHARDLSGYGGVLFRGRWNEQGIPCIYASTHISLAVLETLANKRWRKMPTLNLVVLELPDSAKIKKVDLSSLPYNWQQEPPYHPSTLELGSKFLMTGEEVALMVPSSIVPEEYNVIISPTRAAQAQIGIVSVRDYHVDNRLIAK
jgi:RES domain-containing protein